MKSTKAVWLGLLCLAGLGLSACAGDGVMGLATATPTPYPPPGYTHRVGSAHLDMYYNCSSPAAGAVRLEGLAFNPWESQPVRFLEFELVGVDARGRSVSEAQAAAKDDQLSTNHSTPFELDLKTVGSEVRFDLYYSYQFQEGDHGEIELSKVAWQGPMAFAPQPNRSLVWDACSPTAHLAR